MTKQTSKTDQPTVGVERLVMLPDGTEFRAGNHYLMMYRLMLWAVQEADKYAAELTREEALEMGQQGVKAMLAFHTIPKTKGEEWDWLEYLAAEFTINAAHSRPDMVPPPGAWTDRDENGFPKPPEAT